MSIEAQRRAITEYCATNNIHIIGEYVDEAKSATTANRPQFQKMMDDVMNTDVDYVIVHKLDRFSRNVMDSLKYRAHLEKYDVKLLSVVEPTNDTPENNLLENLIWGINEFYSKNLAREVQKGKKEAAYHKKFLGGTPPLGYDIDDNKMYVINPIESKAVKMFFEMYINNYSYTQIADKLNKFGYRTKKGQQFNKNSFLSLIENAEMYTGVYIYNKTAPKRLDGKRNSHKRKSDDEIIRIPDKTLRIISNELFESVVKKRSENKNNLGTFKSRRYYILNSKIRCGVCGRAFSGNTSKAGRNKREYKTYRCSNYRSDKCDNRAINAEYIEKFIIIKLANIVFKKNTINKLCSDLNSRINTSKKETTNTIIKLKNELVNVKSRVHNLTIALSKNYSEHIQNNITALEMQEKQLLNEIEKIENTKPTKLTVDDVMMLKKDFKSFLYHKDTLTCRSFIRDFVTEIKIEKDSVIITLTTEK